MKKRVIGIDYGLKRIGIAYSDENKILASPLVMVLAEKKLEVTIQKLLQTLSDHQKELSYEVEAIVVGLPLMMSGKSGLIADEVKHFVDKLKLATPVPVHTFDERLTSVQAERSMREANFSRKKRTKYVDTASAVIILQNYLDMKGFAK